MSSIILNEAGFRRQSQIQKLSTDSSETSLLFLACLLLARGA